MHIRLKFAIIKNIMKVFIIHSGKDREEVEAIIENKLKKQLDNIEILILNYIFIFWKFIAKKKIKQSDLVLFFVGETSHESKNIDWEIKTALELKKDIYIFKLNDNNKLNSMLETTKGNVIIDDAIDLDDKRRG